MLRPKNYAHCDKLTTHACSYETRVDPIPILMDVKLA